MRNRSTGSTCRAFRIGRYPITNAQYPAVRGGRAATTKKNGGPKPAGPGGGAPKAGLSAIDDEDFQKAVRGMAGRAAGGPTRPAVLVGRSAMGGGHASGGRSDLV
ncbi:MAG: hypothetical protein M0C28_24985 [Candidatus Moduliflexus flocculans]|nr:hypothetical protein [Candidatus Moduliflexus flocculans]